MRLDASVRHDRPTVVRHLSHAFSLCAASTASACAHLGALQDILQWRQNPRYRAEDLLAGYAYCELLGPNGMQRSQSAALGLLLLAPHVTYPEHVHPATETYVPLAGRADWLQGDGVWRARPIGGRIEHASMEPHAMRTAAEPLLAAYLWHDHLHEGARLTAPRE